MLTISKEEIAIILQFSELQKLVVSLESIENPVSIELSEEETENILDALPSEFDSGLRIKLLQYLTSLRS